MELNVKPSSGMDYFGSIFIVILFIIGFFIYSKIATPQEKFITISPPIERKIASCPPDRLSHSTVAQNVKLISEKTPMFATNGQFINPQVVLAKSETTDSKVACGYLFVRAGTNKGALQNWENVYINPNMFGGHIISKNAISVNDGMEYSEYIFSLEKIYYWPTSAHKSVQTANWAYLLNVSSEVKFDIALNTNDKTGFISEMDIAYKCWNPTTGEENNGCKLYITSSTATQTNSL